MWRSVMDLFLLSLFFDIITLREIRRLLLFYTDCASKQAESALENL